MGDVGIACGVDAIFLSSAKRLEEEVLEVVSRILCVAFHFENLARVPLASSICKAFLELSREQRSDPIIISVGRRSTRLLEERVDNEGLVKDVVVQIGHVEANEGLS